MGEEVGKKRIENHDFTLFYDYDELRDGKLHRLSVSGKIEWFKYRMEAVFLNPLKKLFDRESAVHKELNSPPKTEWPWTAMMTATFSLLLNGIEALGKFLPKNNVNTKEHKKKGEKSNSYFAFKQFIVKYMRDWDICVEEADYRDQKNGKRFEKVYLPQILWEHFRNGIAHAFVVQGGGIEFEADKVTPGYKIKYDGYLEIGPIRFFQDFEKGVKSYFEEVRDHYDKEFLRKFNEAYPPRKKEHAQSEKTSDLNHKNRKHEDKERKVS
jgi:hypothetical protein